MTNWNDGTEEYNLQAKIKKLEARAVELEAIKSALLSNEFIGFASGDREPNTWIDPKKWLDQFQEKS